VGQWVPFAEDPVGHLKAIVVPVFTLAFFGIGAVAATTRHAVLAVLAQPHVTAAVLRGQSWPRVIRRHVLRNASIPVVTITAIYLGYLLGGTVLVEQLFSVPGFGRYLFQGIGARDYTVVQAGVMLAAAFFIVLNMLTDILYAWLDPRIRTGDVASAR
jgi:peptide/nickel transport system permease protein